MFMSKEGLYYIVGVCLGTALGASVHALYRDGKEHEKYELGKAIGRLEGHIDAINIVNELKEEQEEKESK